jgi:RHS repeat-associated protein
LTNAGTLRFGPGSVLRLEGGGGGALQTLTYAWHIRGGLRGINLDGSGNLLTNRLFAMKLDYEADGEFVNYYNGNISRFTWRSQPDNTTRSYGYTYDALSRLTLASGSPGIATVADLTYDANGNLKTLGRAGIDDLTYTYHDDSNKIKSVSDGVAGTLGFVDGNTTGDDYEYWPDGSLKKDRNKQITSIEYYHTKQPRRITFNDGQTIDYEYDAAGTKLRQKDRAGVWTDYVANQLWRNGALLQVAHEEGRIVPTGTGSYRYEWSLVDHLGNNRVSFVDGGGSQPQVVQWEAFGPWGESLPALSGTAANPFANPYVFTGHERQSELGVYDAKARVYDPDVPRFWQIDPMSESYEDLSPYNYAFNNPILWNDVTGKCPSCPQGEEAKKTYAQGALVENYTGSWTWTGSYWQANNLQAVLNTPVGTRVADPVSGFWGWASELWDGPRVYANNRIIDRDGILTNTIRPLTGTPPDIGLAAGTGGKYLSPKKLLPLIQQLRNLSLKSTLPALKSVSIDIKHIAERHLRSGAVAKQRASTSLFPQYMDEKQVEAAVRSAYKNVIEKVKVQGDNVLLKGISDDGLIIEMWLNKSTKVIETAYPK